MSESATTYDDRAFRKALSSYLDLKKNVDPQKELKRRAKNIGIKLIKLYKEKGVNLSDITEFAIGDTIKVRPKIRAKAKLNPKKWTYKRMVRAELNARRSAKGFTSIGWFPAVRKLGGNPQRKVRAGTGPERGVLIEKLTGNDIAETLVNKEPGAVVVLTKNAGLIQQALDAETKDMVSYIVKKQNDAARRNGLA